jgi:hypothetical protein
VESCLHELLDAVTVAELARDGASAKI